MKSRNVRDCIVELSKSLGIVNIGFANASSWNTDPLVSSRISEKNRPQALMPDARTIIVIGIPVPLTILETAPSIYYNHAYGNINTMLDQATQRISMELQNLGYNAVYVPRDGYHGITGLRQIPASFFSHRHAAYLAGLGTFGTNNVLLTKGYGPRMRFASVITDAPIVCDEPIEDKLCIECMKCVKVCPSGALREGSYPEVITEKQKCVEYAAGLAKDGISPCGRCICVCPVGGDRKSRPPADDCVAEIRRFKR